MPSAARPSAYPSAYATPDIPENIEVNRSAEPTPHAPPINAERHHGSEYQPWGTGRPATVPPG